RTGGSDSNSRNGGGIAALGTLSLRKMKNASCQSQKLPRVELRFLVTSEQVVWANNHVADDYRATALGPLNFGQGSAVGSLLFCRDGRRRPPAHQFFAIPSVGRPVSR